MAIVDWLKKHRCTFFALIGGSLLPLSQAPFNKAFLGYLCITLLLLALENAKPRQGFMRGWLFGLSAFGVGSSWIYVSIYTYGNTHWTLACLITGLFVMAMALFLALLSWGFSLLFPKSTYNRAIIVFPVLWVLFEILRGWAFTGFPWLFLGYSQMSTHLMGFAPIGSVWAVSWMTALTGALIYGGFRYYLSGKEAPKRIRNMLVLLLASIWFGAYTLNKIEWTQSSDPTYRVAIVQGNIPQNLRWDPRQVEFILSTYFNLFKKHPEVDLMVWPEGAIPLALPHSAPYFGQIAQIAQKENMGLISGVPQKAENHPGYYNAIIGVGQATGLYQKQRLVPFGEYVPLEKWLRGLIEFFDLPMSNFIPGPEYQKNLTSHGFKIAPLICYEIAYPILVQKLSKHSDFILTISNDTWFGDSIGPKQHLQIAQFRAREMGRPVIRATNTGISAFIQPDGQIKSIASVNKTITLIENLPKVEGQTPWSQYGLAPLLAGFAMTLLLGFLMSLKHYKE